MNIGLAMSEMKTDVDQRKRERMISRYLTLDGRGLRLMTEAGLNWLRTNQQVVNALNVFPVPDGDTGTNMVLTMQAAWDEIATMGERSIGDVAHGIAHGALMGARGNSGVILSQIWRGFARVLDEIDGMDAATFARALMEARDTAYRGVVKPVEGTILTVSSDVAKAAGEAVENGVSSVLELLEIIVEAADESVQRTPELLPVLKEAGVVDSGGIGFYYILDGMLRSVYRLPIDQAVASVQPLSALKLDRAMESIEAGQDWEIVIDFRPQDSFDMQGYFRQLESMGTSIQLGEGDGMYRMHIHVPDKKEYEPIEFTRQQGTIMNVSIENLMIQLEDRAQEKGFQHVKLESVEPNQIAAVTVAPGMGIAHVFASLGAAALIEGGQTMNPSTQEILDSFENLPTEKIIILPNNKNIVLAANQAADLTVKKITVIPTVSIPQGVAAMLALDPEGDFDEVVDAMTASQEEVQSASLTIATRSVEIDGIQCAEGQVIGLLNGRLTVSGNDLGDCLFNILKKSNIDDAELVTIYYGADLSAMHANQLVDRVRERWPNQEVELVDGGQPHYQIILSVE
jgi:DAK2 domain fusion protein YloV